MRTFFLLAATGLAAATVATCLRPALGWAQAVLEPRALDQLGPPHETEVPPPPPPRATAHAPADPHAHPNGPHQTLPPRHGEAHGIAAGHGLPAVSVAPPPAPVLPPPLIVPTRPAPPPIAPTVSAEALGNAAPITDGLRLTFGSGSADLNPETEAAIEKLATSVVADGASVYVTAYAAGTPDDPSTARRLSLSRALAVRSVLITSGVPSARIYVRALGASAPVPADVPPDRVDIVVNSPPPPAPPSGQSVPAEKAAP